MKLNPTIALIGALLGGCADEPAAGHTAQAATRTTEGAMPAVETDHRRLSGTVAERLSAGSYTYLSVKTADGPHWVVTLGEGQAVGTAVTVRSFGIRRAFRSRHLDRTFDELRFGIVRPAS